jgi:hypothetical protein
VATVGDTKLTVGHSLLESSQQFVTGGIQYNAVDLIITLAMH